MRRFYLYAVVGLFASLLWAGITQPTVSAAPAGVASTQASILSPQPVQNFADVIPWGDLECSSDEQAVDLDGSLTDGVDLDINGSAIVTDYIICPIVESMYTGIGLVVNTIEASGLLAIPSLFSGGELEGDSQKGLFAAWGVMRDLANIGIVVGLFIVVFSQATSYGLSAYGIKKMLPRVVIAALLVNLSYIICAVLIDVFNILGSSLDEMVKLALDNALVNTDIGNIISENSMSIASALTTAGLAILVTAVILLILFFLILLLGLVCVVFLVARQILIICLVIAAPLAFIAWLFPNTENYFKKWWSTLIKLLAIYPIVMCLRVVSYVIIIAMAGLIGSSG